MQKYFKVESTEGLYSKIMEVFKERDEWVGECEEFSKKFGESPIIFNIGFCLSFGGINNPIDKDDWMYDKDGHAYRPRRKTKKQKELYNEWMKRNNDFKYLKLYDILNYEFSPFTGKMGWYYDDDYFIYTLRDENYEIPKGVIEITGSEYEELKVVVWHLTYEY